MAMRIDTALKLIELAKDQDDFVRPIVLYYGAIQLCGVLTRTVFDWKNDRPTHGLRFDANASDLGDVLVGVEERGAFPRLATTCFFLSGQPSCFTKLVTYTHSPTAHTGAGELLENFGKEEVGKPIESLRLRDLAEFDWSTRLKAVRVRHGFHKFGGLPDTAFLVDVLTLYLGSVLSRYGVLKWREIMDGATNPYRLHFESTFERFISFTTDRLICLLCSPEVHLGDNIAYGQPNPYTHDDRRFGGDPNCA
jgi:hypothetical protein